MSNNKTNPEGKTSGALKTAGPSKVVGTNVTDEAKKVRFMSLKKDAMFFVDSNTFIRFSNHAFETDNEEEIEFLRKTRVFNVELWENGFPPEVRDKFKRDKEYIYKTEDVFQIAEG